MAGRRYLHDPDAVLDYALDWAAWLGTDTISAAAWTVPAGLTLEAETHTDSTATVWVSGGTAGAAYTVVCHVVTAAGREDDRSIVLRCEER